MISNQATVDQAVVAALRSQRIELPSWAFGNSGTRFKVFAQTGVPQRTGDVLGANGILMDAFDTDVRPLLAEVWVGLDLDPDPISAYARSGYAARIEADRVGGQAAGWGA